MKKLVLFNGPPSSGKDTAADYIAEKYNTGHHRMKDPLYILTAMLNLYNLEDFKRVAMDEKLKDTELLVRDMTARQLLIETSERVVKPFYGKDWFGKAVAKNIAESGDEIVVMSDCGFTDEVYAIIDTFELKQQDVLLVRIHRNGYDFGNDSRNYIYPPLDLIPLQYDINNDDTIDNYYKNVDNIFNYFIEIEKHDKSESSLGAN